MQIYKEAVSSYPGFFFFPFLRFKTLAREASGIGTGCVGMDSIKMANTGNSLVLFPS